MINLLWERKWLVQSKLNNEIVYSFVGLKYLNVISSTLLLLLALRYNMDRDDNDGLELRVWPVKYFRGMVLRLGFVGPYICAHCRNDLCRTGTFAGWDETKRVMRNYMDLYFFFISYFTWKNERESVRKKQFLWLSPKNIRSSSDDDSSSGDDDSRSGDDDSSSSDDDSSSGGVLIWFSHFITHNYELLYYSVEFLV